MPLAIRVLIVIAKQNDATRAHLVSQVDALEAAVAAVVDLAAVKVQPLLSDCHDKAQAKVSGRSLIHCPAFTGKLLNLFAVAFPPAMVTSVENVCMWSESVAIIDGNDPCPVLGILALLFGE